MTGSALLRSLVAALIRWRGRCSDSRLALVVCYHGVGDPPGDPATELVPSVGIRLLRRQLAHLRRAYRVVPLAQLREAAEGRRRGSRFPLAITFDDDLATHAVAARELRAAGLPATFFLSGASLVRPFCFWWEDLQRALSNGQTVKLRRSTGVRAEIAPSNIIAAAAELEMLPPAEHDAVAAELRGIAGAPPADAGIRAAEVQMLAGWGFEIGFHTKGHYVLTTLHDPQLERELRDGRAELEALTGRPLRALAYPHGKADARVAQAARAAGYAEAFTSERSAVGATSDPHLLGRLDASPISCGHLALALARALTASNVERGPSTG